MSHVSVLVSRSRSRSCGMGWEVFVLGWGGDGDGWFEEGGAWIGLSGGGGKWKNGEGEMGKGWVDLRIAMLEDCAGPVFLVFWFCFFCGWDLWLVIL